MLINHMIEGSNRKRFWYVSNSSELRLSCIIDLRPMPLANRLKIFTINWKSEFWKLFRPLSISWEVRKTSSPMKMPAGGASIVDNNGSVRQLVFMSWADRVKGATPSAPSPSEVLGAGETKGRETNDSGKSFLDAMKRKNGVAENNDTLKGKSCEIMKTILYHVFD